MRLTLLTLLFFFSWVVTSAQSSCACCTVQHGQFDFWLGEWNVSSPENKVLGQSSVTKMEKDCIVREEWSGASGVTGRSFNYYDVEESTWKQLWLDSGGSNLNLTGEFKDGSMVLQSGLKRGKKISWYYDRITWTKIDNNTVSQMWEILDANERRVSVAFHGVYRRKI
ncbi:hypothetical protein BFP72_16865 [Reichenbachiella sp. 5M10]|uniref:hypothetical protein n=1 Tax=Reichenbachiella sp. 5M10 TaxID=1889772 RepID=UPI000C160F18|nr:hypothetical protein [Reichenbachiella sp. 5M10]PIB36955.1 hypothetical protein BFP72_16865 [Reichenbachiella sp. 5M10]